MMKRLLTSIFLVLPVMVAAQQRAFSLENFSYDVNRLDFMNGKCKVELRVMIPPKFMERSTYAELMPVFRWSGGVEKGDVLTLQGERCHGYGRIVSYKNGITIDMPIELIYQDGMENGSLYVDYSFKHGGLKDKYKSLKLPLYVDQTPYLVFEAVKDANFHRFEGVKVGDTLNDALIERSDLTDSELERMGMTDQVLMTYPDNYQLHNNLAICYLKRDNLDLARKEFERAFELNPESKEVAGNLSLLCLQEKNVDDAILYMKMAEGTPAYDEIYGNVLIIQGRSGRATGLMSNLTTNSAILAHIINQDYGKAGQMLDRKVDRNAMTYYLQAMLAHRTDNRPLLESSLRRLRSADPHLFEKAQRNEEFADCQNLFKGHY